MVSKRNNIIFLLTLCTLLVLIGCYLLTLAPDVYKVDTGFATLSEYNAYRLMIGKQPALGSALLPVWESASVAVPRNQSFPYGEKTALNINLGLACLAGSLIYLAFLIYELQVRRT